MGYYSRVGLGLTLLDVSENDQIRNIQYESCIYNRLVEHGHRILLSSPDPSFLGVPWMPPCCASSGFQQCFRRVSPVSHYYLMTFWEKLWSKLAPWWTKSSMAENRLAFVKLSMPFHAIRITGMAWFYMIIYIYMILSHFNPFHPFFPNAIVVFHRFSSSQCQLRFLTWARQQEAMDGSTLLLALIYETASQPGKTRRLDCWTIFWRCADCLKMYVWYCLILYVFILLYPFVSFGIICATCSSVMFNKYNKWSMCCPCRLFYYCAPAILWCALQDVWCVCVVECAVQCVRGKTWWYMNSI